MIPASIPAALISILAGVNAAYPLATATVATLAGLQQQAHDLIVIIDAAIAMNDPKIIPPNFVNPISFAASIASLASVASDQAMLAELAALAGRAGVNLSNAGA